MGGTAGHAPPLRVNAARKIRMEAQRGVLLRLGSTAARKIRMGAQRGMLLRLGATPPAKSAWRKLGRTPLRSAAEFS